MNLKNSSHSLLLLPISVLLGILIGAINTVFGKGLLFIGDLRNHYLHTLLPLLPLAGIFILLMYQKWGNHLQKGMGLVLKVGKGKEESIPTRLIFLVMVSTWMTHLFGGSAGREGVAVQIGATTAHQVNKLLPIPNARQSFIAIGIAAGFAGLFQTPIAAIFFAFELLQLYRPSFLVALSTSLAAFSASTTSHLLGLEKFTFLLTNSVDISISTISKVICLAVILACIGNAFAYGLTYAKQFFGQLLPNPFLKMILLSVSLSLLLWLLHDGRYTGLGTNLIEMSLSGQSIYPYDWFLKLTFTILTLAAGFQGGEVTPLFAIGTSAGVVVGSLLGLPIEYAAALGYSTVFAAATNTWLAPTFIGLEVFGTQAFLFFPLVTSIAFFFHRKKSIYN